MTTHLTGLRAAATAAMLLTAFVGPAGTAQATYAGGVGSLAFGIQEGDNVDVYSVRPDGTGLRRLTHHPGFDACAAYDARGARMAYCSDRTGTLEIWTMRADGTGERQLTRLGGRATFPDFSPSGHQVAFANSSPGSDLADIWTIGDDGRHPRQLTHTPDHHDNYPAWSPDGRRIVFVRFNADRSRSQLWVMDADGSHQRRLTSDPLLKDQLPDWRPDGRRIAYEAGRDIWLMNPDGSGQVNVTNTPDVQEFGAAWSPDGRRIAYLDFDDRVVSTMRPDGSDVRAVRPGTGPQFVPAWQPLPRGWPRPPGTCTTGCVTTYETPVPPDQSGPFGITRGPLDSQWFAYGDRIGRIDGNGRLTTYAVPTEGAALGWMAELRAGQVWFTERGTGKVGWIRVAGGTTTIREYTLPSAPTPGPQGLVLAGDGNVYVTHQDAGTIVRLDPRTGRMREFGVPFGDPLGLTLGPDGALWFVQRDPARIGRMTLDGRYRSWALAEGANPNRITVGPDGNIWFTELRAGKLGRIVPGTGRLTEYPIDGGPVGITAGKDGSLYVVLSDAGALARVNLAGRVTGRWQLPGAELVLQVATGRGLDVWVTDSAGRVYRVTPYLSRAEDIEAGT